MRENDTIRLRWPLGSASTAVGLAAVLSLMGGQARAQDPPIYPFPLPTATPFKNPNPPPPSQPESGPKLMKPFPVVRTAGWFTQKRTTFSRFTVKGSRGVKVVASCKRAKCRVRRTLKSTKTVHLRPLERTFKAGTHIRLRLTAPNVIGKYVETRTRRGKRPLRRDACLRPGLTKPVSCGG